MINYFFSMASFQKRNLDAIKPALENPAFSKIVFPAELPIAPNKTIHFSNSNEFNIKFLPKEFITKDRLVAHIPLDSNNGISFSSTIYLNKDTIIPNILSINFNTDHLDKKIISLLIIKRLLDEIIPVFEIDQASIQDTYTKKIPHESGGYGFEKIKDYQTKEGIYYQLEIGWLNYFGPRMLKAIGRDRFANLQSFDEIMELHNGILTVLQKEPIDNSNPSHMKRKIKAEKELGFFELQKD